MQELQTIWKTWLWKKLNTQLVRFSKRELYSKPDKEKNLAKIPQLLYRPVLAPKKYIEQINEKQTKIKIKTRKIKK